MTTWSDEHSMLYHREQWEIPKQSTLEICKLLAPLLTFGNHIVDLGCGTGGVLQHLARNFPKCVFSGFDVDEVLISEAQKKTIEHEIANLSFSVGNLYEMEGIACDGVLSIQTLSWLDGYELALTSILKHFNPKWFFCSSLFYEGDIDAKTVIIENTRNRSTFYNTYSLPRFSEFVGNLGYNLTRFSRFDIDIDLPRGENADLMQTFTTQTDIGKMQISGPLLMNWYFVLLERVEEPNQP